MVQYAVFIDPDEPKPLGKKNGMVLAIKLNGSEWSIKELNMPNVVIVETPKPVITAADDAYLEQEVDASGKPISRSAKRLPPGFTAQLKIDHELPENAGKILVRNSNDF